MTGESTEKSSSTSNKLKACNRVEKYIWNPGGKSFHFLPWYPSTQAQRNSHRGRAKLGCHWQGCVWLCSDRDPDRPNNRKGRLSRKCWEGRGRKMISLPVREHHLLCRTAKRYSFCLENSRRFTGFNQAIRMAYLHSTEIQFTEIQAFFFLFSLKPKALKAISTCKL